jgi:hypothetical protein
VARETKRLYSLGTARAVEAPAGGQASPADDEPTAERPLPLTKLVAPAPVPADGNTVRLDDAAADAEAGEPGLEATRSRAANGGSAGGARRVRCCPCCGSQFSSGDVQFCPFDGHGVLEAQDWDPTADPLVGKTASSRYQIEGVIAEGSMGMVYRVRHTKLDTAFAMKVLRRDIAREPQVAARLVDEARATAAIGHPGIVAVTDFGEIGSDVLPELGELQLPYFVMELLPGRSLGEVLRADGPLAAGRIARIMVQCAAALAAAHDAGIIHRDLKPGNIRILPGERDAETAKVLDFGVAKIIGRSQKTQAGVVYGTPHYMSPEQGRGHPVDPRTDIYALGIIMYECLTGKVPFEADTYMGVVTQHLFTRPEPPTGPGADPDAVALEPIVMRCLAKEPADRYPSMQALIAELEQALEGGPAAVGASGRRSRSFRLRDEESQGGAARLTLAGLGTITTSGSWLFVVLGVVIVGALLAIALRLGGVIGPSAATAPSSSALRAGSSEPRPPVAAAGTTLAAASAEPGTSAAAGTASATASLAASATQAHERPGASGGKASAGATGASGSAAPTAEPRPAVTQRGSAKPRSGSGDVVDPWGSR